MGTFILIAAIVALVFGNVAVWWYWGRFQWVRRLALDWAEIGRDQAVHNLKQVRQENTRLTADNERLKAASRHEVAVTLQERMEAQQ
jgi:hypothetical protein